MDAATALRGRAQRVDLDHAAHRVVAVEGAVRPLENLDRLDVLQVKLQPIEVAHVGPIGADAVEEHQRAPIARRAGSAERDLGVRRVARERNEMKIGLALQQLDQVGRPTGVDVGASDDMRVGRHVDRVLGDATRGHDHGWQLNAGGCDTVGRNIGRSAGGNDGRHEGARDEKTARDTGARGKAVH